jgi:ankyrin repeat protein
MMSAHDRYDELIMITIEEGDRADPMALLNAVETNDINVVIQIRITDQNKNAENDKSFTPLIHALLNRNYDICSYLLSSGVDVNYVTKTWQTALTIIIHIAQRDCREFSCSDLRFILLFLRHGADVKLETPFKTAELCLREMGYEVIGIYLKRLYGLKKPTLSIIGDLPENLRLA